MILVSVTWFLHSLGSRWDTIHTILSGERFYWPTWNANKALQIIIMVIACSTCFSIASLVRDCAFTLSMPYRKLYHANHLHRSCWLFFLWLGPKLSWEGYGKWNARGKGIHCSILNILKFKIFYARFFNYGAMFGFFHIWSSSELRLNV